MVNIGIFCSASANIAPVYFDAARQLGRWMGENAKTLVYGGASLGLMECVAEAVKENGGKIIGVVPEILEEKDCVSLLPDRIIRTRNLSDRKDVMLEKSDVLVALPGGVGTLDEIFHVMAAATIGYHTKKLIFYNLDGFFDDLIEFLHQLEKNGFSRYPLENYYKAINTIEELQILLK